MIKLSDLNKSPETRKLTSSLLLGVLVWIFGMIALMNVKNEGSAVANEVSRASQVLNYAVEYKASPMSAAPSNNTSATTEPLALISGIVEENNMRDRVSQLASNQDGALLQINKLYGDELAKLLKELDAKGLSVKTAEVKALPSGEERLFSATLTVVPK